MLKISQKLNFWWSILYYLSISIYQSFFLSLPFRILSLSPLVFLTFCSSSASFFLSIFFIIFLFFVACPQLTISGIGLIYAFTAPLVSSPSCCCIVSYRTVAVRERSMARLLTATTLVRSKFIQMSLFSYSLKKLNL